MAREPTEVKEIHLLVHPFYLAYRVRKKEIRAYFGGKPYDEERAERAWKEAIQSLKGREDAVLVIMPEKRTVKFIRDKRPEAIRQLENEFNEFSEDAEKRKEELLMYARQELGKRAIAMRMPSETSDGLSLEKILQARGFKLSEKTKIVSYGEVFGMCVDQAPWEIGLNLGREIRYTAVRERSADPRKWRWPFLFRR